MNEIRRSPATLGLCAAWILVFVAMQIWQASFALTARPFELGVLQTSTTHLFGDATSAELTNGQLWRALTSTFIHFSLIHLVLNVMGLLPLGMIIESWYGWAEFLLVYVLIGTVGNLIAGEARPWVGIPAYTHCGGGSTVVFGLIALCAVAGWRSKSKEGRELGRVMFGILALNYAIGAAFWAANRWLGAKLPSFDHLAHLSGTLLGALVGLAHQPLKRAKGTRPALAAGVVALLSLAAAFGFQLRSSRAEIAAMHERAIAVERWQQSATVVANLMQLDVLYHLAFHRGKNREFLIERRARGPAGLPVNNMISIPEKAELDGGLKAAIDANRRGSPPSPSGTAGRAHERLLTLASQALEHPPSPLELQEFEARYRPAFAEASQRLRAAERQLAALAGTERSPAAIGR